MEKRGIENIHDPYLSFMFFDCHSGAELRHVYVVVLQDGAGCILVLFEPCSDDGVGGGLVFVEG